MKPGDFLFQIGTAQVRIESLEKYIAELQRELKRTRGANTALALVMIFAIGVAILGWLR